MQGIEFRFWDAEKKRWDYFTLYNICLYHKELEEHLSNGDTPFLNTGLKDKNSKKIYEGDFLNDGKTIYQVVWKYSRWELERVSGFYRYPVFDNHAREMEVIGNIYENPELLKE